MLPFEDRFSIAPLGLRMPGWFMFPGSSPCCCGDCTIFSDDFGTDTLASNYTTDSGTWAVSGGKLSATSASARVRHNTVIPTGTTAIHCQVTITCATTSDAGELVFAYTDANNYWYASVIPGATDGTLKILQVSGGTTTQRGVAKKIAGFVAGNTLTLAVCYSGGLVTAHAGGEAIRCYSVTLSVEGTYCGLKAGSASSSVEFDDFTISRSGGGGCPTCNTCTPDGGNICNVCDDEIGTWPTDWPSSLNFTISGSCCASLNRSWSVPRSPTFTKYYDSSLTTTVQITGCGGRTTSPQGYGSRVEVLCDGAWIARLRLSAGTADPTIPPCATPAVLYEPTLLSCDPLHLVGTGETFDTGPCLQPNAAAFSCSGTFNYEITE